MLIKRGVNAVKKRRKILKLAKGYYGAKSKLYRVAREAVMKSLGYSFVGRKLRKRQFRQLWIARISAACKLNGLSYEVVLEVSVSVLFGCEECNEANLCMVLNLQKLNLTEKFLLIWLLTTLKVSLV